MALRLLRKCIEPIKNVRHYACTGIDDSPKHVLGQLKKLGVIGVPFGKGQRKEGVEDAPDVLRRACFIDILKETRDVTDYGNLVYDEDNQEPPENMICFNEVFGCNKALVPKIQDILAENDQILTIGGDHTVGFGSVAGHLLYNPNLVLVWVDAHTDIHLDTTTESGNIHGMPVSFLVKELRPHWAERTDIEEWAPNSLPANRLFYIGARDIDKGELEILKKCNIKAFKMKEIKEKGIDSVLEEFFQIIGEEDVQFHVSYCIDSLDPKYAPCTGVTAANGLSVPECIKIMQRFAKTNRVKAVDLVEINPKIGTEADLKLTLQAAFAVMRAMFASEHCVY